MSYNMLSGRMFPQDVMFPKWEKTPMPTKVNNIVCTTQTCWQDWRSLPQGTLAQTKTGINCIVGYCIVTDKKCLVSLHDGTWYDDPDGFVTPIKPGATITLTAGSATC